MPAACKKTSGGDWFTIINTKEKNGSNISTLRGPYKTRKCAQAEARKQKRRLGKDAVIDIVKTNDIQSYLSGKR